jgi:hypothetical protein
MWEYGYGVNDAFWRVVWAIDEGTTWANGFSDEGFSKIRIGMTKEEVLSLAGKPLHDIDNCDELCIWAYTRQDSPTSDFDQRWVVFDQNQKVFEIRKSFYID